MRLFVVIFLISMQIAWIWTSPHKCYLWDAQCTTALARAVAPTVIQSISDMNGLQIEPMSIGALQVYREGIELDLQDIKIYGLKNLNIDHFSFDTLTNNMSRIIFHTEIYSTGRYKSNGSLFSVPVCGAGSFRMIFRNLECEITTQYNIVKDINGIDYVDIKDHQFRYDMKDVPDFQYENLYYGNKELSDNFHYLMNKNWKLITEIYGGTYLRPVINTMVEAVRQYLVTVPLSYIAAL